MTRKASLLVALSLAVFLVGACLTTASWSGMAEHGQTNQHLDQILRLGAISEVRTLTFQDAARNNSTQESRPLTLENMTRIIVPISRVENASSSSTQPSNGFVFPTWIWIPVILVLLMILAYLFVRLLREGDDDLLVDKRPVAPASTSEAQSQQSRQIPINKAEIEAERKETLVSAEGKTVRSIPIDTEDEAREPESDSK